MDDRFNEIPTRARIAEWAIATKSPYHCVECGAYVGFQHVLRPKGRRCRLGSTVQPNSGA